MPWALVRLNSPSWSHPGLSFFDDISTALEIPWPKLMGSWMSMVLSSHLGVGCSHLRGPSKWTILSIMTCSMKNEIRKKEISTVDSLNLSHSTFPFVENCHSVKIHLDRCTKSQILSPCMLIPNMHSISHAKRCSSFSLFHLASKVWQDFLSPSCLSLLTSMNCSSSKHSGNFKMDNEFLSTALHLDLSIYLLWEARETIANKWALGFGVC